MRNYTNSSGGDAFDFVDNVHKNSAVGIASKPIDQLSGTIFRSMHCRLESLIYGNCHFMKLLHVFDFTNNCFQLATYGPPEIWQDHHISWTGGPMVHCLEMSISSPGIVSAVAVMAIKMNETLRELYLADNRLMPSDCIQLGKMLKCNNHLQLLDVRNNHLLVSHPYLSVTTVG